MRHSVHSWLAAAALVCVVACHPAASSRAESPLPNLGVPAAWQAADSTLPGTVPPTEQPTAYVLPPVGWPAVDFSQPDPLLDRPGSAQPGFFANAETDVLWLHLHNRLSAPVPNAVTGAVDQVNLGRTPLDTAASPRFEVGYRLPDNWGTCSFGYGFLTSQGREQSATGPEASTQALADKRGRLASNLWDLTYGSREYSLEPFFMLRWGVGARLMSLYFDASGDFLSPGTGPGGVLAQSETNYVQAYGFWAYLDVERHLGPPGLSAFFHLEGSDFYARIHQTYSQTVAGGPGLAPETSGAAFSGSVGPSILREVIGVGYTVPRWNSSRFLIGYQYEQFFQVGRLSLTSGVPDTRGSLDANGLFLRAEFNF
jgi:hypothetical protein